MCKIWPDKTLMSPSAKEDGSEERWNKKKEGHEGKKWAFSMKGTECQRWRTSGEESERSDVVVVVVVVLQNPHGLMILDGKMKTGDWGLNPLCRKCWEKKQNLSSLSPRDQDGCCTSGRETGADARGLSRAFNLSFCSVPAILQALQPRLTNLVVSEMLIGGSGT